MPSFVDTHCHLDFRDDLSAGKQIERARAEGVELLITVGTDMASSAQAISTASRHDGVHAVVGVHPNDAMEATSHVLEVIDRLAGEDVVVGVGETGLDYYRDHATPEQQEGSFRAHIGIAKRHGKALMIHCRDTAAGGQPAAAWDDCLRILDDEGAPERVVMHCFSGDVGTVERCAEAGYLMSFAGNVTFPNADALRLAATAVPRGLLLTETDSPFLSPHPHRGESNEPARVAFVARTLAELHDVDVDTLAQLVLDNAKRAFELP